MKIEVNDYVRTKKGIIGKIKLIDNQTELEDLYLVKRKWYYKEDFIKSSPNIIDILQVGDYVNGYLIIEKDINNELRYIDLRDRNMKYVKYLDIKSIVTREQFSCMEYKIGE